MLKLDDKRSEAKRRALASLAKITDEADARVTAAVKADPDAQPISSQMWTKALPLAEHKKRR